MTRPERDELCGYVSLRVSEIVLQCITTAQGESVRRMTLYGGVDGGIDDLEHESMTDK